MNLLLGVTGGIAAYKACEVARQAMKAGATVRVVMTPSATRFVGPLTFEGLTNQAVMVDALATGASAEGPAAVEHVQWAKWADVAVVAPLTANTLAKLAVGLSDNALTTVLLALPASTPVVLAPAMNTAMWRHPATVRNRRWLDELGHVRWVQPATKQLACGDVGEGALAEPEAIVQACLHAGRTP